MKNRKIQKASELLWVLAIVFVAFGVAICSKADLGVSMIAAPAFIIAEVIMPYFSFLSVGVVEYMFQGFLLLLLCIIIRKFDPRFLLAFAASVLYGYTLNFFLWLMKGITFDETWLRWVMLIVGDIILAFGVACFFRTYLPPQAYELFVADLTSNFKLKLNKVKSIFDVSMLALTLILAFTLFGDVAEFDWTTIAHTSFHNIGLGTFVTTVINSPIIMLMGKVVDGLFIATPRFPKLASIMKRN